jgi:hypothetical protein
MPPIGATATGELVGGGDCHPWQPAKNPTNTRIIPVRGIE